MLWGYGDKDVRHAYAVSRLLALKIVYMQRYVAIIQPWLWHLEILYMFTAVNLFHYRFIQWRCCIGWKIESWFKEKVTSYICFMMAMFPWQSTSQSHEHLTTHCCTNLKLLERPTCVAFVTCPNSTLTHVVQGAKRFGRRDHLHVQYTLQVGKYSHAASGRLVLWTVTTTPKDISIMFWLKECKKLARVVVHTCAA